MSVNFKLATSTAKLPERGSEHAAGYDLFASESVTVKAKSRALVPTGVEYELPNVVDVGLPPSCSLYARVAPRSGLAKNHGIDTLAGVCDIDYRAGVGVILYNSSDEDITFNVGDRVAQLIIEVILHLPAKQVDVLSETRRGRAGFGSTGISTEELEQNKKQKTDVSA